MNRAPTQLRTMSAIPTHAHPRRSVQARFFTARLVKVETTAKTARYQTSYHVIAGSLLKCLRR